MTTIRQFIQTSPTKANDLFAKLVETSGSAVKTRERLFSELKEELELQMRLEEQHLFPVLRKRKETKDLVPSISRPIPRRSLAIWASMPARSPAVGSRA